MNAATLWRLGNGKTLDLSRPAVMAILNVTPDSFSDGGALPTPAAAVESARVALQGGAVMLDIGGESTRPGADRVSADEQIRRVVPAIAAIRAHLGSAPAISIDTTQGEVASAALDAGADAVNDVSAGLEDPALLVLCAQRGAGLVLMHRLRPPGQDSYSDRYTEPPTYQDVVEDVRAFLAERLAAARLAGIDTEAVVLDPGLGFGKTVEQNLALIRGTGRLVEEVGRPVLSGLSRKSFVARVARMDIDAAPATRIAGTLSLTIAHVVAGARLVRGHDPDPLVRALQALECGKGPAERPRVTPVA